jgi:iron complex outermembrane receptor protein
MSRALIFGLLILMTGVLAAQDCKIRVSGQVLDRATLEPLEYSSIAIEELNQSLLTDSIGKFLIEQVCPGSYHIQVFHLGCPPARYFIFIQKDTVVNFYLDHHGELLREVVVESKTGTFELSNAQQSISENSIRQQAGKSLADITEQIAGIRALRNGSGISKPVIHGLYGNRVAVVNNGLLQAGQQWGVDHAPEIDPNAINSITVVKGADAIAYGSTALGGALLVEAGPINRDPHFHGTIGYAYESNGRGHMVTGMATKSFTNLDWRLTGTWKKAGDHRAPDYFLTNTGASELNGSFQVIYQPSERMQHQIYYSLFTTTLGILAGAHVSNLTDLEEAIGRATPFNTNDYFSYAVNPPKQEVVHHLLKYSGKKFLDEKAYMEWVYGLQSDHRQEFDIRRGNRSDIPALDLQLWANSFQFKFINERAAIHYKAGAQMNYTDNENSYDTGVLPLIPDYRQVTLGLFGLLQYPVDRFTLEGGARYDLQVLNAWPVSLTLPREIVPMDHVFQNFALTAGVVYSSPSNAETRLHTAATRRSPEPNELYSNGLHQGVAGIEEGNWDLESELSWKTILTQSVSIPQIIRFEFNIHTNLIKRYIYLKPSDEFRLTIRGAFPVYQYTQEDAWIRGLDVVMISDFSHHLEWNAKFSWVKGSTLDDKRPLTYIPAAYGSSSIAWAFHDGKTLKGTRISLEGEYTAMQKDWDPESDFLPPPDDYFLFNMYLNTGLKMAGNMLHLSLGAENLFNIRYRDYLNRLRYFADEQGLNITTRLRYVF